MVAEIVTNVVSLGLDVCIGVTDYVGLLQVDHGLSPKNDFELDLDFMAFQVQELAEAFQGADTCLKSLPRSAIRPRDSRKASGARLVDCLKTCGIELNKIKAMLERPMRVSLSTLDADDRIRLIRSYPSQPLQIRRLQQSLVVLEDSFMDARQNLEM